MLDVCKHIEEITFVQVEHPQRVTSKNESCLNAEAEDIDHRYEGAQLATCDLLLASFGERM